VLSHVTAGVLWKLLPPHTAGSEVDVTVTGQQGRRRRGIRTHQVVRLDPRDVRTCDRLPVTAPARTLIDIAAVLPAAELERAFGEGIALRLLSVRSVEAAVARAPGRPGRAAINALLRFEAGPAWTRSRAEQRLLGLVRAAGLPEPEVNARIGRYTVDFLWRRERLVLEVDGRRFHTSGAAFQRDRRKGTDLVAMGLRVMRTTDWQIENEALRLVVLIDRGLRTDKRT
jgi:very-short-patch-repair endonuclease